MLRVFALMRELKQAFRSLLSRSSSFNLLLLLQQENVEESLIEEQARKFFKLAYAQCKSRSIKKLVYVLIYTLLGSFSGAAEKRVIPGSGPDQFEFGSYMSVTLSCDHRVIDGTS